jgi:hypothetical protein
VPSEGHHKDTQKWRKESDKKVNKKLVLLFIPLLAIAGMSFGYAHFTADVYKKYDIHVGSVLLNITGFHVDYAKMPDVDNNGIVWGEELNVTITQVGGVWYELIQADPITGGFVLNTTTWLKNCGKLPFAMEFGATWDGPFDSKPDWTTPPTNDIATIPSPPTGPWSWHMEVWKHHYNSTTGLWEVTGPWSPTMTDYKPGDYIEVKQHVDFNQPDTSKWPLSAGWQAYWQCHWIKIWVHFHAFDVTANPFSSNTIGTIPTFP